MFPRYPLGGYNYSVSWVERRICASFENYVHTQTASESDDDAFEEDEEFTLPPELAPAKLAKKEES